MSKVTGDEADISETLVKAKKQLGGLPKPGRKLRKDGTRGGRDGERSQRDVVERTKRKRD